MLTTIQVDLDGLWTYRRYRGQNLSEGAYDPDPVYTEGVARFLALFRRCHIKATFFVVGKDAVNSAHRRVLAAIVAEGHEIANHSMNHLSRFSGLPAADIEREISLADEALTLLSNGPISGFRAPMFSADERVLPILSRKGYLYDASLMPSFLNPLLLNVTHALLSKKPERMKAGKIRHGFAPLTLYRPSAGCLWRKGESPVYEVPYGVIPFWRIPFHSSWVFAWGTGIAEYAVRRMKGCAYLFHGIDLVDMKHHNFSLPFFGTLPRRITIVESLIKLFRANAEVLTTRDLVRRAGSGG